MDAKDLRTEPALGERSSDGTSKYTHIGTALPCSGNKNYQETTSNPLAKMDTPTSRPCAVIGPDRVIPLSTNTDAYIKKTHYEPWPPTESTFRHPPEYPHKTYQSPIRNISPRQTFQENMQRIMVAPTYSSIKTNEDTSFMLDRNATLVKSNKLNGPAEPKYCEVPYTINHLSDQKNTEMCVSNVNNPRNCSPMWHPGGVNVRPARPYGAPEIYQFPEYASCAGSRPMAIARPPRTVNEDNTHVFSETYYNHGNIRFKPYPNVKERYPQARYDYVNNYSNPFHPPSFPSHKFDLQKPVHASYPQVPIKYLDNRITESVIDGYQRPNQQINYNAPYPNQMMHPTYRPMLSNGLQNKLYPYPSDKPITANKLPYENNKLYTDYDHSRNKSYAIPENFYLNEMARPHVKSQVIIPNYPAINMQTMPPHPYYRKENSAKSYEYIPHFRHDHTFSTNNHLTRITSQFSPNGIPISPSDSSTSNETAHAQVNSLEDCGYVSQSSSASGRSIESGIRIMPNDMHRKHYYGYSPIVCTSPFGTKPQSNTNLNISPKDKQGIDVRQFLQMWNEGDDENTGNSKETHINYNHNVKSSSQLEEKTQEQLYVLGLVNVPSEELGKYEHIQKVSKLPDNIKGYNNIELLKHFEEAIESSNLNNFNINKLSTPRSFQSPKNCVTPAAAIQPRPVSPLDVEAKISQSVIHKEVGCNFEIKPCSPEMLNVEVATPVKNILEERVIEKVSNPYQSSALKCMPDNVSNCNVPKQDHVIMVNENVKIPSCKLINTQCSNSDDVNVIRPDYTLQDLESNSGVCLASLPRLDNDIELNFPEVNQQFINANKESVITSNESHKTLDINNPLEIENKSDVNANTVSLKESDKEFSKLSKYRKNKKSEKYVKDPPKSWSSTPFLRTDSVIIKNPENIKCYEDTNPCSSTTTKLENQNKSPMLQSNHDIFNLNDNEVKDLKGEMAIDFSINKSKNSSEKEAYNLDIKEDSNKYESCSDNLPIIEKDILNSNENSYKTSNGKESVNLSLLLSSNERPQTTDDKKSHTIIDENKVEEYTKKGLSQSENTSEPVSSFERINIPTEYDVSLKDDNEKDKNDSNFYSHTNLTDSALQDETESIKDSRSNSDYSLTELVCDLDCNFNDKKVTSSNEKVSFTTNESEISTMDKSEITKTHREGSDEPTETNESYGNSHVSGFPSTHNISNTVQSDCLTNFTCDNKHKHNTFTIISTRQIKSCNLKKSLFSPWIQKLILHNSYTFLNAKSLNQQGTKIFDTNCTFGSETTESPLDYCLNTNDSNNAPDTIKSDISKESNEDKCNKGEITEIISLSMEAPNTSVEGLQNESLFEKYGTHLPKTTIEMPKNTCGEDCNDDEIHTIVSFVEQRKQIQAEEVSKDNLILSREDCNNIENRESKKQIERAEENPLSHISAIKYQNVPIDVKKVDFTDQGIDILSLKVGTENHEKLNKGCESEAKNDVVCSLEKTEVIESSNILTEEPVEILSQDMSGNPKAVVSDNCEANKNVEIEFIHEHTESKPSDKTITENFNNEHSGEIDNLKNESNQLQLFSNDNVLKISKDFSENENICFIEVNGINDNNSKSNLMNEEEEFVKDCQNSDTDMHISHDKIRAYCGNENRRQNLKRSLSDSAIDMINSYSYTWAKKRRKNDILKICNPHFIQEPVCDGQNNRRNSISSIYNEDNLSFCILIEDDCIIAQDAEKICVAEISENFLPEALERPVGENDMMPPQEILVCAQDDPCELSESFVLEISDENSLEKSWVDDIGCVETVVSDDIAEDVTISVPSSPKDAEALDNDASGLFNSAYEHTDKVKYIYGDKMCNDDAEFVETLYRTPQMNVNKTLSDRESLATDDFEDYDDNKFHKNFFESKYDYSIEKELDNVSGSINQFDDELFRKENNSLNTEKNILKLCSDEEENDKDTSSNTENDIKTQDETVNSFESSIDNVFSYSQENDSLNCDTASSPEVSSTTSEEKSSSILLKITNYKGMRMSQLNESNADNSNSCCKFTENINYTKYKDSSSPRPLITKGAQKYIPPVADLLSDLKVKLPLPQTSLLKLKQLKLAKTAPKQSSSQKKELCKKPKPRFEDVLKSIDEIQFKMHKEKSKKPKKCVPKVIIKKTDNGSHYASVPNKAYFNPDLTGRKWQPWVFIEKNCFIDKMVINRKTKAIFNHRKNTFVLADKFQKYKSVSRAKFIMSQPKLDDSSVGHLKYTIKLKHT